MSVTDINSVAAMETGLELFKRISLLHPMGDPEEYSDNLRLVQTSYGRVKLEMHFYSYGDNADVESLARLTRVRRVIGGTWEKNYYGGTSEFKRELNGLVIELNCSREATCKRVVVRTEEVPESVTPAYTKEIVEWICDE
jgi:hypothetical protein